MRKLTLVVAALSCLTFSAHADTRYGAGNQNLRHRFWKPTDRIPWPKYRRREHGITIESVQVESKTGDLWVNIEAESGSDGSSTLTVVDVLSYANGLDIDCQDIDVNYRVADVDRRLGRGRVNFTTSDGNCSGDDPAGSHIHVACTSDAEHKVDIKVDYLEQAPEGSTKGNLHVQQASAVCRVTVTQGGNSIVLDDLAGGTLTRVQQ